MCTIVLPKVLVRDHEIPLLAPFETFLEKWNVRTNSNQDDKNCDLQNCEAQSDSVDQRRYHVDKDDDPANMAVCKNGVLL